jgi:hypothetical protein
MLEADSQFINDRQPILHLLQALIRKQSIHRSLEALPPLVSEPENDNPRMCAWRILPHAREIQIAPRPWPPRGSSDHFSRQAPPPGRLSRRALQSAVLKPDPQEDSHPA